MAAQQELYRVYRPGRAGWKLVQATSPERAVRKVKGATGARLVRPSSYWRDKEKVA